MKEEKKSHLFGIGTEMYVFVNNFVHFTFQALKLEKWPVPNMIKRFPKGFGMKIIFRIVRSVEKYFQKNFFGYGEGDFGKISTVKY